jgi:flavin reductase (DIM6/NTAB) family NADH-FMN oxidoreductase RutF
MQHRADRRAVRDSQDLRQALGRFATGVAVITTRSPEGKLEGVTANSFSSVSLDPPLVLWSLQSNARSLESFRRSGFFAVNVLGSHQHRECKHFATPAADKFGEVAHELGLGGCPVLPESIALFECSAHNIVPAGDHLIFIGHVERAVYGEGEPLIFCGGSFSVPSAHEGTPIRRVRQDQAEPPRAGCAP